MSTLNHCLCSVDIRVVPHHILPFFVDTNRMLVLREQVFVFAGCYKHHNSSHLRTEVHMEALKVVQASFHGLSQCAGAVDGFRLAGFQGRDTHDAICSPQGVEDNMEIRGGCYSQGDMEGAEHLRETWQGPKHFLVVHTLDPEDSLELLDQEEAEAEAEEDMAEPEVEGGTVVVGEGEDPEEAADVQKIPGKAKA